MELREYWKMLVRRWWLVVAPCALVLLYIVATYRTPSTTYQVVMRFAAGTQAAGLSEDYDRYYPWLTSEYIANGLADVAITQSFAQAVSERLAASGHHVPAPAIRSAIVSDNANSIMVVYLAWHDADQIIAVAEAITSELTDNAPAYFPQVAGVGPAVRPLDAPEPIPLPPGLRAQLLGPAIRMALALAVGVALALVWHYLDPVVREAGEVEEMGLGILAEIPRR
ncbi:MAG: hypothetical protein GX620_04160 [Chloroflexi bacterium]|nr:hypothetical protein [Chloroflexota bacterium]